MVDERLSTSDKGSEQALHMCERELQYVKNRWEMDVLYLLLRFPSKTMVLNDSYQLRIFYQQFEAYCVSLIQYNLDYPISQQNTARRHISLSYFKYPQNMMDNAKFGFSSFAEQWNGRLAMMGFIIGLGTELLTGQSILHQIGLG